MQFIVMVAALVAAAAAGLFPTLRRCCSRLAPVSDQREAMMARARPLALRALAAVLGVLVGSVASRAEEAVLLASTAPGYAPGMVVAESERLIVPEGASATLLFRSGEMLRVRGPFDGPLGPTEARTGVAASIVALAETLRRHGVDAAVLGGTRSLAVVPRRRVTDNELVVDAQSSATYCVGPASTISIARTDEPADKVFLRHRGSVREVGWSPEATRASWPTDIAIADGEHYEIVDASGAVRATLMFHIIAPPTPAEPASVAKAALKGCHEQAAPALRELGRAMAPREIWVGADRSRGSNYRTGDRLHLIAQANVDGWLYCVHRRADGSVVPVFPSGALDGARVRGHEPLNIPGQRRSVELPAGPPGEGQVSCWFADRDIGPELPHALLADASRPLPESVAERLDAVFEEIGGKRLVKTVLPVQVVKDDTPP
jgi:hypothetical protein